MSRPLHIRSFNRVQRIDEIESRIREFIVENGYQEGQTIPGELWFTDQLGVGRPLIREAMRRLEAVGMLESHQGKGRILKSFDLDSYLENYSAQLVMTGFSLRELLEARCVLELALIANAVHSLGPDQLESVERVWMQIRDAYENGRVDAELDITLHQTILVGANNRLIVAILDAVLALARKSQEEGGGNSAELRQDFEEHQDLVHAVLARDGVAARDALARHFSTTASRVGFPAHWVTDTAHLVTLPM